MKKSLKKGFTLVELVIVIAVIAILSAVLIPTFGNVIQNSKDTAAFQNASNAVNSYLVDQANQGNNAALGEGYIIVFAKAKETATTTEGGTKFDADKDAYIFKYDGNSVVKIDNKFVKGTVDITVKGLTVTAASSDTSASWATTTGNNALPLNYKITDSKVSATVWWIANDVTVKAA